MEVLTMKAWKKFAVASLCLATLVIGGCAVSPKPSPNTIVTQVHKENYSRFVEKYKSLNLDCLVSEDFEYQQIKKAWSENTVDYWSADNRENLGVDYIKMTSLRNGMVVNDRSFYVLGISDFTNLYYEESDKPGNKMTFEAHYNLNGEPYSIAILSFKPTGESCRWVIESDPVFAKNLDGSFYANHSKITSGSEIEQVKELFELASEKFKKIKSLVEKQ